MPALSAHALRLPRSGIREVMDLAWAMDGPVIGLHVGEPSFATPEHVLDGARRALAEGATRYVSNAGIPPLRAALAEKLARVNGLPARPEQVIVTNGGMEALFVSLAAVTSEGDEVLLPDPGYPDYHSAVALAGARHVALPLDGAAGWQPRFEGLRGALCALNWPSNPCAVLAADGVMEEAVAWAHETGTWLVHDIAYGFLGFERRVPSILEVPGAREVATELWSPSKIYGMAGWRVGFLVGNAEVVGRVRTLVDHMFAGVPVAIQRGLLAALTGDQAHVAERRERYRVRRDVLVDALPGLRRPEGSFYAWWELPDGLTPEEIIRRARVGVAPGIGFGSRGAGHVRLSLAVPDEDVAEGAARLGALVS